MQRCLLRKAAGQWWLLDLCQSGEHYHAPLSLNETGAFIFQQLQEGKSEHEIALLLADEQEDVNRIEKDVHAFHHELIQVTEL